MSNPDSGSRPPHSRHANPFWREVKLQWLIAILLRWGAALFLIMWVVGLLNWIFAGFGDGFLQFMLPNLIVGAAVFIFAEPIAYFVTAGIPGIPRFSPTGEPRADAHAATTATMPSVPGTPPAEEGAAEGDGDGEKS